MFPTLKHSFIDLFIIIYSYLVALSLQEEQKKQVESCKEWEQFKHETGMEDLTDEELAKRLQEEEDNRYASQRQQNEDQQQHQQQPQQQPHHRGGQQIHPNSQNSSLQQRRSTNGGSEDSENGSNKSKSKNVSLFSLILIQFEAIVEKLVLNDLLLFSVYNCLIVTFRSYLREFRLGDKYRQGITA